MPFSSLFFLFGFLPVFLLCYFLTPNRYRNHIALLGSLAFYGWGAPQFLAVLLLVSLIDYSISWKIYRAEGEPNLQKAWMGIGVLFNLSLLAYFKYSNFVIQQLNDFSQLWLGKEWVQWTHVIMPIGISFVVFEEISYLVDVYRGKARPAEKFGQYALFLFLFPHAIAGPIFRWQDLENQLQQRKHSLEMAFYGGIRFFLGLGKKVLIADQVAVTANLVFAQTPDSLPVSYAWLGVVAYTLQIYFDFSGYSDMAIGLGAVMGFRFKENFNAPYISQTITEFWKRWHISLSTWMRDYLYIPLGGNRGTAGRTYFNLGVVFLVSGLWHGANWTFLCWGGYHGLLLILDRLFWARVSQRLPRFFNSMLTLFLVMVGWVLFRSESLSYAWRFLLRLFAWSGGSSSFVVLSRGELLSHRGEFFLIIGALICVARLSQRLNDGLNGWMFGLIQGTPARATGAVAVVTGVGKSVYAILVFLLVCLSLVNSKFSPFIYFRF